jgi:hypothetical protein
MKKRSIISDEAMVHTTGKKNPFRAGCGAHRRVEVVRRNLPARVREIRVLENLKRTTLATCERYGLIAIENAR